MSGAGSESRADGKRATVHNHTRRSIRINILTTFVSIAMAVALLEVAAVFTAEEIHVPRVKGIGMPAGGGIKGSGGNAVALRSMWSLAPHTHAAIICMRRVWPSLPHLPGLHRGEGIDITV